MYNQVIRLTVIGGCCFDLVGITGNLSHLKDFRTLVVTNGGFRKGDNSSGEASALRFTCNRPIMTEKKRGCNGSVCTCTQKEE